MMTAPEMIPVTPRATATTMRRVTSDREVGVPRASALP
jgi:hypothetical protein